MPEVFIWREGQVSLWTGSATPIAASAVLAYAENMQAIMARGYDEHESIDGVYARHLTGQSVDLSIQALYTTDATIVRMVQSATAMHIHMAQSGVNGSAGFNFYSGVVTTFTLAGDRSNPHIYSLSYRGNLFSAYGV
jgi:hypothetical protein